MWKIYLAMILVGMSAAAPGKKREVGDVRTYSLSSGLALPGSFGSAGSLSNLYSDYYNYPLGAYGAYAPYYPTWYDSPLSGLYPDDFYDDDAWDSVYEAALSGSVGSRLPRYYF